MWYTAFIRFLRRRSVLGLILTISLCYYIFSFVGKSDFLDSDEIVPVRRTRPFIWRTLQQHNNSNDPEPNCRNSVQGKVLIVDDRGYVCPRHEILSNGCCNDDAPSVLQYSCETCKSNNCCVIFEYCIACCLHPDKKDMLENILTKETAQNNVLFASVTDHFELCLTKCRTNSQSVQHENSYRDPRAKHCYGELAPGTTAVEAEV